MDKINSHFKI